jgi:hypothetical protein
MSDQRKSAWPNAIQVKNRRRTICIEEKLDIISWLIKGERIVDVCHNVRLAHCSVHTICDNAAGIKESAKSGTKLFVSQDCHGPVRMNHTKKLRMGVSYIFIALEINKYIV